jgi:hypothetical protein
MGNGGKWMEIVMGCRMKLEIRLAVAEANLERARFWIQQRRRVKIAAIDWLRRRNGFGERNFAPPWPLTII